jgi:hypothetical protein
LLLLNQELDTPFCKRLVSSSIEITLLLYANRGVFSLKSAMSGGANGLCFLLSSR